MVYNLSSIFSHILETTLKQIPTLGQYNHIPPALIQEFIKDNISTHCISIKYHPNYLKLQQYYCY